MNMTDLKARIEAAYKTGKIDEVTSFKAYAAISSPTRYGKTMTPRDRDCILTHRFGI